MRCTFFPGGVICSGRRSLPKCSTPGCRNRADKSCDAPVTRENPPAPKPGDTRLHREHKIVFYVWTVDAEASTVIIGQSPPPLPGQRPCIAPQKRSFAEWFAKSDATCDRPICSRCATEAGELDLCQPHAREATKQLPAASEDRR